MKSPNNNTVVSLSLETAWSRALEDMAHSHVTNHGLTMLDYCPVHYPEQGMKEPSFQGNNLPVSETDKVVANYLPTYYAERNRLLACPETLETMFRIIDLLYANKNVFVAVPHSDLLDIVYATLLVRDMVTIIMQGEHSTPHKTALLVSKMVAMLARQESSDSEPIPVLRTLGDFTSEIFLSLPETDTAEDALQGVNQDVVKSYNSSMYRSMLPHLNRGGLLIGIAPTGTTQQVGEDAIKKGTTHMLTKKDGYVVPVAVRFSPRFQAFIGEPKQHSNKDTILQALDQVDTAIDTYSTEVMSFLGTTATQ